MKGRKKTEGNIIGLVYKKEYIVDYSQLKRMAEDRKE